MAASVSEICRESFNACIRKEARLRVNEPSISHKGFKEERGTGGGQKRKEEKEQGRKQKVTQKNRRKK